MICIYITILCISISRIWLMYVCKCLLMNMNLRWLECIHGVGVDDGWRLLLMIRWFLDFLDMFDILFRREGAEHCLWFYRNSIGFYLFTSRGGTDNVTRCMHTAKKAHLSRPNAQDFLRKARVNKRSDSPWRVRFDGLFLSHISILCWSFARWRVSSDIKHIHSPSYRRSQQFHAA